MVKSILKNPLHYCNHIMVSSSGRSGVVSKVSGLLWKQYILEITLNMPDLLMTLVSVSIVFIILIMLQSVSHECTTFLAFLSVDMLCGNEEVEVSWDHSGIKPSSSIVHYTEKHWAR